MPLTFEIPFSPDLKKRYRRLAGPFDPPTKHLLDGMMAYMVATGARVTTVGEPVGVCVWRLRSECETYLETERRLAKLHKK